MTDSDIVIAHLADCPLFVELPPARLAQRVAGYLADLAEPLSAGVTVPLPATKKVIASRLGMTPEAFSRALRDLAEAGMIKVSLSRITVKQPVRLRELSFT